MKTFLVGALLAGIAVHDTFAIGAEPPRRNSVRLAKSLNQALAAISNPRSSNTEQSIQVVRVSDGQVLYDQGASKALIPASVTKLVTSATALSRFGPERTFTTRFYRSGPLKSGVIKGDLIVVGDGDPYLVSELLWQFAADMRHMGIREIRGDIVIDNSLFDQVGRDESRLDGAGRSSHAYDAPISAFGINFNSIAIAVSPGAKIGSPALVNIDPYEINGVYVENRTKTSKKYSSRLVNVVRHTTKNGLQRLVASGFLGKQQKLMKIYRSVNNHVLTSGETLKAFLRAEGVVVRGRVKSGFKSPSDALVYELNSYPLRKIVAGLNQFSNNYIADVLTKRLGAAYPSSGRPNSRGQGTLKNGVSVLSKFLRQEVGITSNFTLKNGSGLSVHNRLSASHLTQLLVYMARRLEVFPEFLSSLPSSGRTGTMKKRLLNAGNVDLRGKVRAKTGTLSSPQSVSSLAGYVRHPSQGLIAFAIIQNGKRGRKQPAIIALKNSQDRFLATLLQGL